MTTAIRRRERSALLWNCSARLNELDSIAHLIGFEHFPDEDKARDDLAEAVLSLMTVCDPGVLDTLSAER